MTEHRKEKYPTDIDRDWETEVVQLHLLDLQYLIVKQLLYMKLKESLLPTNHFSLMVFLMEESLLLPPLMALAM